MAPLHTNAQDGPADDHGDVMDISFDDAVKPTMLPGRTARYWHPQSGDRRNADVTLKMPTLVQIPQNATKKLCFN